MTALRAMLPTRRLAGLACALWLVAAAQGVGAQPAAEDGPRQATPDAARDAAREATREVDAAVARALFEQARLLHERGRSTEARVLLREALERSSTFEGAAQATALLALLERAPGPGTGATSARPGGQPEPATSGSPIEILDPYAGVGDELFDPYGDEPVLREYNDMLPSASRTDEAAGRRGRTRLLVHGGLAGLLTGLAVGGPAEIDERGDVFLRPEGLVLGLVGLAGGVAAGHLLSRRVTLSDGQAAAMHWSGVGGALLGGALADVVSGIDTSEPSDIARGVAVGALLGTGAGYLVARRMDPGPGDVALASSLGLYGALSGLFLGAAMQPQESEAYSINMMVGAGLGLGLGVYAARRIDTSRRRMLMVDLGAAVGAAVPWLVFGVALDEPVGGGLGATLGMAGGAYLAWRLTRSMDAAPERVGSMQIAEVPVPALIQRRSDGQWSAGSLMLRPVRSPATTARGWAVDVLGGRF